MLVQDAILLALLLSASYAGKRRQLPCMGAANLTSRWSGEPPGRHQAPGVEKLQCWEAQGPLEHQLDGLERHQPGPRSGWSSLGEAVRRLDLSRPCDHGPPLQPRMTGCSVSSRMKAMDRWRDSTELCPGGLHRERLSFWTAQEPRPYSWIKARPFFLIIGEPTDVIFQVSDLFLRYV